MLTNEKRSFIIASLEQQMSKKRLEHVLRVEQKALELASLYDVDITACQLAALLHDLAKEWTMEQYETVVKKFNLPNHMLQFGSEILHGPVASCVIDEMFDVNDERIQEAIACHTIGASQMDDVAKVLFVADYIEDGRVFDGVEIARELAKNSLEDVILYKLQQTIAYLAKKQLPIYPETIETYNTWIIKKEKMSEK